MRHKDKDQFKTKEAFLVCQENFVFLCDRPNILGKGGELVHPAETSNNSDICDFLKVSDIENCMVVNGKMYILNHSS